MCSGLLHLIKQNLNCVWHDRSALSLLENLILSNARWLCEATYNLPPKMEHGHKKVKKRRGNWVFYFLLGCLYQIFLMAHFRKENHDKEIIIIFPTFSISSVMLWPLSPFLLSHVSQNPFHIQIILLLQHHFIQYSLSCRSGELFAVV